MYVFHTTENRTMAFLGKVTPERWSRLLRNVDDMTRFAVSRVIGEDEFDYRATWRTNSTIIGSFIGVMIRAKIGKEEIVRLCEEIFNPVWRRGLEKAVHSIDEKGRIPFPEKYMELPLDAEELKTAPRRQCLLVRNNLVFFRAWPRMEASVNFLLRWRGIRVEDNLDWAVNYINMFQNYVSPDVVFNNLNNLEFCILNAEKSSKLRTDYVFPPNLVMDNEDSVPKVIMVTRK